MLLYADQVHEGGDFLENLFIHQKEPDGKEIVTVARRAQIDYHRADGTARFYLENGTTHATIPGNAESYQVSRFDRHLFVKPPDEAFKMRSSLLTRPMPKNWHEQSLDELAEAIQKADAITHVETRDRVIGTILSVMHERFALPFACLAFAILGLPLGIMNRRGGKASGFSLSIGIAVIYWILLLAGENLVSQGAISPYVGLWIGNVFLTLLGILLFILRERSEGLQLSVLVPHRLERALAAIRRRKEAQSMTEQTFASGPTSQADTSLRPGTKAEDFGGGYRRIRRRRAPPPDRSVPHPDAPESARSASAAALSEQATPIDAENGAIDGEFRAGSRRLWTMILGGMAVIAGIAAIADIAFLLVALSLLAMVLIFGTTLDRYVLGRFGMTLIGALVSFFTLFAVYEFINLIDDLVQRNQPLSQAFTYLTYRSPWILAQVLPMSCLVATFLTFGIMSRFNEVTAVKASGTSVYRMSMPVLMAATTLSILAYLNYDYLMPFSNQRASQLKDAIRGRSPRSYLPSGQRWVFGDHGRLYNFTNYIPAPIPIISAAGSGIFQSFSAYDLDPATFEINGRVYARTATFEPEGWVLRDGWVRDFRGGRESFETFSRKTFDFPEGPSYFIKDWKSPEQMNYRELRAFARDLRRRGYDVQEIMVDLYGKTSFPLVTLTMVMMGLPFCFRMGKRGSLYGIGIAIMLVAVFLLTFSTTNALGGIGVMPPFLAAWAPNLLFAGSGIYLLLRTKT
jgi:LPS export ABC transporter permease LptG